MFSPEFLLTLTLTWSNIFFHQKAKSPKKITTKKICQKIYSQKFKFSPKKNSPKLLQEKNFFKNYFFSLKTVFTKKKCEKKNSSCDKTQNLNLWQNSKTQVVTKPKNPK